MNERGRENKEVRENVVYFSFIASSPRFFSLSQYVLRGSGEKNVLNSKNVL